VTDVTTRRYPAIILVPAAFPRLNSLKIHFDMNQQKNQAAASAGKFRRDVAQASSLWGLVAAGSITQQPKPTSWKPAPLPPGTNIG
jgi:hypothetical protein